MKKKLTAVALVVCMLAIMLVGASLAYFTDTDSAENTFTMGNVSIDLYETDAKGEKTHEGLAFENVTPAVVYDKDPTVVNDGTNAAYMRVRVEFSTINYPLMFDAMHEEGAAFPAAITEEAFAENFIGYDASKWDMEIAWDWDVMTGAAAPSITFYYVGEFAPEAIATLFTDVKFAADITNEEAALLNGEENFAMNIVAEAIQVDTFEGDAAAAWAAFDAE